MFFLGIFYLGATWVVVVKAGQGHNALGLGQVVINGFYLGVELFLPLWAGFWPPPLLVHTVGGFACLQRLW